MTCFFIRITRIVGEGILLSYPSVPCSACSCLSLLFLLSVQEQLNWSFCGSYTKSSGDIDHTKVHLDTTHDNNNRLTKVSGVLLAQFSTNS